MKLAIEKLMEARRRAIGLTHADLVRLAGYANEAKGVRRLEALFAGDFERTQFLIAALPAALGVPGHVVKTAVEESVSQIADAHDAEYRLDFRPHAIVLTEREIPEQIMLALILGSPEKKRIELDTEKGAAGYIQQALRACPDFIYGFGKSKGIVINYTPDRAVLFDMKGNPVEVLPKAYRLGTGSLVIGTRQIDRERARRFIWGHGDVEIIGK